MTGLETLPGVAREAILARLEKRAPKLPVEPEGELAASAPVFVTLKIGGELRGCMGELSAQYDDLVHETMDRAVIAAFSDPRFPPLTRDELVCCDIDVTLLGPLEAVDSEADLDAARYGVEVTDDAGRRAVLLPAIEGVDTVERQLEIVRRKAGIPRGAAVRIRRFEVRKITEPENG